MRSTFTSKSLKGSALLKFNPQAIWQKAFRDSPAASQALAPHVPGPQEEVPLTTDNRLIQSHAIYVSEPDDVRRCIERLLPNSAFNLVLTNKTV